MHPLVILALLAHAGGLTKTEKNLLGYLPTVAKTATSSGAALQVGCDGEVGGLEIEGTTLRFSFDGEEGAYLIEKVEATNAGTALQLSRTGTDKRDPHSFEVEWVKLDPKKGTWRVRSDPDGLASGKFQRVVVDDRRTEGLPRQEKPASACPQ